MHRWWMILVVLAAMLPAATNAERPVVPGHPAGIVWQIAGVASGQIYAGTWCGAYELVDRTRWREIPGLKNVPARRLVRLEGDVLLATTVGWSPGGVWRHAPGEAWQRVLDVSSASLAVSPDGRTVYAAFGSVGNVATILRSRDIGRTWTQLSSPGTFAGGANLAVGRHPRSGADVLLVTLTPPKGPPVLRRSPDGGQTWEDVSGSAGEGGQAVVGQLFVDAGQATYYVASTRREVPSGAGVTQLFRGQVVLAGLEPVALPDELRQGGIVDLVALGDTLIVGGPAGVFISTERGNAGSWRRYGQGLAGGSLFDLHPTAHSPVGAPATTYAATSTGVYEYSPVTDTWYPTGVGLPTCNVPGRTVYDPVPPFPDQPDHRYFAETGHALSFGFKTFWEHNGGLPVFGYPLSEEFDERNVDLQRAFATQYLERERFEYHPEQQGTPYTVLLGRLGDELLAASGRDWRLEDGTGNPFGSGPCRGFDVGGEQRSVCGPFLQYWQTHGLELGRAGVAFEESLALFGLPLTAPKLEVNPDGDRVLTQWFERARFEYHPTKPEPFKVLLGRLGAEALRLRGVGRS